jgi:hypothetical protein
MINPSILLRAASIVSVLYFAGHQSGMPWTPAVGPAEVAVIDGMKSRSFDVMGTTRTYTGVVLQVHHSAGRLDYGSFDLEHRPAEEIERRRRMVEVSG